MASRGGVCRATHQYAKPDNKYSKHYYEYWDVSNLYEWVMSQKLPVNFIENYNEDNDKGYFLEVDVQYPDKVHDLQNNLPFSPKKLKIEKVEKHVANLHDKKCVIHIRNLKLALSNVLVLTKVPRAIKFNQEAADVIKTTSKKAIKKTAEATGYLIDNEIAVSKSSPQNSSEIVESETENIGFDREILKERYTPPGKRQQTIIDLRLI